MSGKVQLSHKSGEVKITTNYIIYLSIHLSILNKTGTVYYTNTWFLKWYKSYPHTPQVKNINTGKSSLKINKVNTATLICIMWQSSMSNFNKVKVKILLNPLFQRLKYAYLIQRPKKWVISLLRSFFYKPGNRAQANDFQYDRSCTQHI